MKQDNEGRGFPGVISRPLYQQVAAAMEARLEQGVWGAGKALPSEPELARLFGVSIGTVRRAVEQLVDRGHLVRRQGSGTYVRRYCESGYWNRFQRFQSSDRRIIRWENRLLRFERVPASEAVARGLGVRPGDGVIHVVRNVGRPAGDGGSGPVVAGGYDQSWLPVDLFHGLREEHYAAFAGTSLYELYEQATGVIVTDVRDVLDVMMTMEDPLEPGRILEGPFYRLSRTARTFGGRVVELRLETPLCLGLTILFDD